MKKKWSSMRYVVLFLMLGMQVLAFLPSHLVCDAACCNEPVSCCDTQESADCEMGMTSCTATMFVPLLSAPLLKVDVHVDLEQEISAVSEFSGFVQHHDFSHGQFDLRTHSPPKLVLPLLI